MLETLKQDGFFCTPLELRNNIYRFFAPQQIQLGILPCPLHDYCIKSRVTQLLRACRRFHNEFIAVLYRENTFASHIAGLPDSPIAFIERVSVLYARGFCRAKIIHLAPNSGNLGRFA